MHNLCHHSRLSPWLGKHNSMWGKCPHSWHHHPHKYTMHHQCNKFKPPPPLHPHHWDKCSHNKTIPTSLPPTINKGKLEITSLTSKAIINYREEVNNCTLPIMSRPTGHPKNPHERMHQDATLHCTQTNLVHSVMSMGITRLSVPSWLVLSRTFKMRSKRPPMPPLKPNPTRHHKDLLSWCFKTGVHHLMTMTTEEVNLQTR